MQLKLFLRKSNQVLFSGNILKLFFSYKGTIGRVSYIIALLLLLVTISFFTKINLAISLVMQICAIYCFSALIQKRSRSFNSTGTWYILAHLLFLYTVVLTYDIDVSFFPKIRWYIYFAKALIIIVNLILVLRPSKHEIDEQKRSFLTRFPVIFTILAFFGIFCVFGIKDKYMPDTNRPAFHLGLAVGEIFRHTYAYPEFCKAQGFEMVNYPNKVREKFKEEIEIAENDQMALLNKASKEKYENIHDFYKSADWGTPQERIQGVIDFFEALRKRLIIREVAEEQKIDRDKVILTKQDDERASLMDACKVVDEDADYFVSIDCPFNYILNYAGKYSNCGTYFNTKGKE